MRAGWLAAAALAAAGLAACRGNTAEGAIPRERFVKANVELRSVSDTAPKGDSLRAAALRKYRVTERDLTRFVRVHGHDPEYLSTVWREVADSVQRRWERSHRGGPGGMPPATANPDLGARPDSTLPPTPPRPGTPVTARPPRPIARGLPPRTAPSGQQLERQQKRTPRPPPDRARPMTPPDRTVRPPPH